jgi:hypothetical protein
MKLIDISSNNHTGQLFNWHEVRDAGYDGAYIKATQGNYYVNPYLLMDVRDCINAGMQAGIYHFYDPNVNPLLQAVWFQKNGIDQFAGHELTLLPVVDIEQGNPANLKNDRDIFCSTIGFCAQYMNRSFWSVMGIGHANWCWLAEPGYTGGPMMGVPIVQVGSVLVPGIPGVLTDIDDVIGQGIGLVTMPVEPKLTAPIIGGADCVNGGYWLCGADGAVYGFDAPYCGGMNGHPLNRPIVAMAGSYTGKGYALFGADGGVFCFGDYAIHGSIPALGIAPF